jgi:formate hydrogenlyase subunit 6/NADH:ubiquinone oxidoreductase subunit I
VCIHCGRCVSFCPHDCLEVMEVGAEGVEDGAAEESAS